MPTYFLTVFKLPKWAEKEIDWYRRSFLWQGTDPEHIKGGHCLVKWKHCIRPRKLGGLSIKDLDHFRRALRLRWLWHSWDHNERPWKRLLKHHDKADRELFFNSMIITVGDGKNTPFWEAKWLHDKAPKQFAPNLYKQARFKYRTVHKELQNFAWIKNLRSLASETLMEEFVLLYTALCSIHLTNEKDTIRWRWTSNGEYTAQPAYDVQFIGAVPQFKADIIWKAAKMQILCMACCSWQSTNSR